MITRLPVAALLLVTAVAVSPAALAAFECLPGPTPGGLSDWAGMEAFNGLAAGRGVSATVAIGRPAAVDRLAWSYASVNYSARHLGLFAEGYHLAFEDLYRESVVGLWAGRSGVWVGLRGWQAEWVGGIRRGGWTVSALARTAVRPLRLRLTAQDFPLNRTDDPASPVLRLGCSADLRLHRSLAVSGGLFRSRIGAGVHGELRWSPIASVTIRQELRFPSDLLQSGLELDVGHLKTGFWIEPSSRIGPRIGLVCSSNTNARGP